MLWLAIPFSQENVFFEVEKKKKKAGVDTLLEKLPGEF